MGGDVVGQGLVERRAKIVGIDGAVIEDRIVVAAAAVEVVRDQLVDGLRIDRAVLAIGAADFGADDALARRFAAIPTEAQAGNLREAPGAFVVGILGAADATLQRQQQVGALEAEGRHGVAKRQNFEHVAHGHVARLDAGAQAAAILDRDLRAVVLRRPQHGIGDDIAHGAFAKAAGFAAAVQDAGGLADHGAAQFFQRLGQFRNHRQHFGIFGNAGVEQDGVALPARGNAVGVEGHFEVAQIFAVGAILHDQDGVATGGIHDRRIRPARVLVRVGEQRVAVAADDDVDAVDGRGQGLVIRIADVAEQDDLVDALRLEIGDDRLQRCHVLAKADGVARAGAGGRGVGGQADDADLFAIHVEYGRRGDLAGQVGVGAGVDVGAEHRQPHGVDEFRQVGRAVIELVIAHGHGLVAEHGHIVGRFLAAILGVVE